MYKILIFIIILTGSLFSQTPVYYPGFPKILDSTHRPSFDNKLPLITDLEKDGQKEIIITTTGSYLYVIKNNGANLKGFPKMINSYICGTASGDIDGNGLLDIVIRTMTQIIVIDKWGNILPGFPVTYNDNIVTPPRLLSIFDIDNNGKLEIIVSKRREVCVFNFDGTIRSGWPRVIVGEAQVSPAIGDIDNDGFAEIILATYKPLPQPPYVDSSALRIYRNDGSNFSNNWPIYYDSNYFNWDASPTLFLNKTNTDSTFILMSQIGETINFYEKSRNMMYDIYGNVKRQSHIITAGNAPGTLVMGDINRDGLLEFVNGEQADGYDISLYGYYNNLQVLNNWPRQGGGAYKLTPIIGKFQFGNELSVLANTWNTGNPLGFGYIYGNNYDGTQLQWSPLRPEGLANGISCADINNDGSVELIAVASKYGTETRLHIWTFQGIPYSNEDFPWPQYGHDRYRTNQYGFIPPDDPIGIQPINSNVPVRFNLYQNYPNPFNPVTNIRFDISGTSVAQTFLSVYDVLGREVTTLVNEELKAGEYKVSWDASNYSSGIYFYRIVIDSRKGPSDFGEAGLLIVSKKLILMK